MAKRPRRKPPAFKSAGSQGGNPQAAPNLGLTAVPPDDDQPNGPLGAPPGGPGSPPGEDGGDTDPDSQDQGPQDAQGGPQPPDGPAGGVDVPAPASDDDMGVEMQEDGSAVVQFGPNRLRDREEPNSGWWENLADSDDEAKLDALAAMLIEKVEADIASREAREQRYAEGIKRTGIVEPAPGGASFEGASKVTHPILSQVSVDYAARMIKELFPRTGAAKASVMGTWTSAKQDRADRKAQYFNELFTSRGPEIKKAFEVLGTQQPLAGEGFLKVLWESRRKRPTTEFVNHFDIILPPGVASFETSHRFTHRQTLVRAETEARMRSGLYRDIELEMPETNPDSSAGTDANKVVEGEKAEYAQGEGVDLVYEINVDLTAEDWDDTKANLKDGEVAPYIVSVHPKTGKVLGLRRNWDQDDTEIRERLEYVVQFGLIPWENGVYIGIWDLVGSLSTAATGALRALLDSALVNNSLTAIRLKGTRIGGQDVSPVPTQIAEIEGSAAVDDIRKLAMPVPFNPPSPVLFQLLEFLLKEARSLIQTSLEDTALDTNANTPVGTQLSRVEQVMTVFSSVFNRQHQGFNAVLRIMHRLCKLYLDDEETRSEAGDTFVKRMDFQGACDVTPTSDPDIYSDVQRYSQLQATRQMAMTANAIMPGMYDLRAVDKRLLTLMHVDGIDEIMPDPKPPPRRHAVAENNMLSVSSAVLAYPDQDHLAHIKVHLSFALSPMFGMGQMASPRFLPAMLTHINQHLVMFYSSVAYHIVTSEAGLTNLDDLGASPEEQRSLDKALSVTNDRLMQTVAQALGPIMPHLQALQQAQQQLMQQLTAGQAQPDPLKVAQVNAQTQQAIATQRNQTEMQKLQLEHQQAMAKLQQDQQLEMAKLQASSGETQADTGLEQQALEQREREAQIKAAADLRREQTEDRTALIISQQRARETQAAQALDLHNAEEDRDLKREEIGLQHQRETAQHVDAMAQHDDQMAQQDDQLTQQRREADQQHRAAMKPPPKPAAKPNGKGADK